MGSLKIVLLILLIWSIHLGVAENIIISPFCVFNSPPSCVTLSQYISSNNRAAASLVLLPGFHFLISPLRVQNSEFVYLQGQGQSDQVTVSCNSSSSPDVEFVQVNEVSISNLVFVQCSVNITGSLSSTVSISYAEFRGPHIDRGFSIVGSNNVSISHSIFQNHQSNSYTVVLYYFNQINNLKLSHCMIRDIQVYRLFIGFRGINKTEIFQCNFTNNTMGYYSIVDFRQTTSVRISCCAFENNYIGRYASANVLYFDGDTIGVTNTTFSNNIFDNGGNIANIHLSSIFGHISCSTFRNNSFSEDNSEVIGVYRGSISISNSTFTLNRLMGDYGDILYCSSSCTVISSVFKNNSVGRYGYIARGVSIFASEFAHNSVRRHLITGINIVVDCTLFLNNSFWNPSSLVVLRNSEACNQLLVIGERATSTCSDCEGKIHKIFIVAGCKLLISLQATSSFYQTGVY